LLLANLNNLNKIRVNKMISSFGESQKTTFFIQLIAIYYRVNEMKLSAIITKENGEYVALCPELDVASQGDSVEEALANLKEAVELYLEDEKEIKVSEMTPFVTTFEVKINA